VRRDDFEVETAGSLVTDVTDRVDAFARGAGTDGLLHVFLPHATAGLALMETGAGSEEDLEATLDRLFPRDGHYKHGHGPTGHGRDHLLPTMISPSLTLPVEGGRLGLGTWQRVVIVDPNRENNLRRVHLSLLEG
jgi:secondary thiamine-phosphate synthase enzyme